ncbi:MAG TPA: aminotransferase class V-fold PLP-dependent enzyme [Thermoleophilaceae bacterium]|nr:aminotransferase class V-fold PLP-dependent enzyme [Thermoleophilaceae bacterium]
MRDLLDAAAAHAAAYLESLPERPVEAARGPAAAHDAIHAGLADGPLDPRQVLDELVADAEPGITAMGSPRYFGFVIGGALPAAIAADWMATTWDQAAGLASPTPAAAVIEEIAGAWVLELLGLPPDSSFAFVTGCQMAHVTALAAARHRVLADAGWDVEREGLIGAPPVRVIVGEEGHVTVDRALRLLGLGTGCVEPAPVDPNGAIRADALADLLGTSSGATIVCAQAGNVNTGAVDPLDAICDAARGAGAWVHVDGAFGLWANASPRHRSLLRGCERADSWATDAHKWLNVPYDCGVAVVADRDAHCRAMAVQASYLQQGEAVREPMDWTPEFSRRARAVPVYAALRSLGRTGVTELVDRLCECAERFADRLAGEAGVEVLAQGLNQVLMRPAEDAETTDRLVSEIQRDGTCWVSATTWRGVRCMRISVCNWQTTFDDVDRSLDAMLLALERTVGERAPR